MRVRARVCACARVEEFSPSPKSRVQSVVDNHRGAKWGESLRSPGREKSYFPEQMQTPGLPKPASLCANTAGSRRARAVWVPKVEAISRKSPSCLLSPALKANDFWVKQQVGWEGLLPVPPRSPIPRPDPACIPDFSARSFSFRSGAAPQSDGRPHMKWSQGPDVGIAEVCGGTRLAVMQDEKGGRAWTWGVHLATSLWFQLPHFLRPLLPPSPPPQPPFHTGIRLEVYSSSRARLLG